MAAAFEESALEGMVPWEAGNARYLMKAVGAKARIASRRLSENRREEVFKTHDFFSGFNVVTIQGGV